MCAEDSEADQLDRLLAFLAPVMSLETTEDRIKTYKDAWVRLNPAAQEEVWQAGMAVNFPWSAGKVDLWRALRRDIETRFHTALSEHLNGEFTHKPTVDYSFMHYTEMLFELLDIFLKGLDGYIEIQDHITAVSKDMEAYASEDERYMSEKTMRSMRIMRAKALFDVIGFMHAVPQRVYDKWDALDHEWDVTWFRGYCRVYQDNEELMAFLRDCAVVVMAVGHFQVATEVQTMHACYVQYAANV